MSARLRPELEALDGGLEEAVLLARLADAVLDYVTDDGRAPHPARVRQGRVTDLERVQSGPCMPDAVGWQ